MGNRKSLTVRFLGQCGFKVETKKVSFAIDPVLNDLFDDDGNDIRLYQPVCEPEELNVDYIFCTHEHIDHLAMETILRALKNNKELMIIVPKGCVSLLTEQDVVRERVVGVSDQETITLNKGELVVTGISTAHPNHSVDEQGFDCNLAYCIEADGVCLVHLGDTYYTKRLESALCKLEQIDVIFSPINGDDEEKRSKGIIGNMNCEESARLVETVNAQVAIPTHYDMVQGNTANPQDFKKCLEKLNAKCDCVIMELNEEKVLTF